MINKNVFLCPICGHTNYHRTGRCLGCTSVYILTTVGRYNCDIVINNPLISSYHLDIIYVKTKNDKSFYVIRNYGWNGTVVNGKRLQRGESITIVEEENMPLVLLAKNYPLDWNRIKEVVSVNPRPACPAIPQQYKPTKTIGSVLMAPLNIVANSLSSVVQGIGSVMSTIKESKIVSRRNGVSYYPACNSANKDSVYSSIFAPGEVKCQSHMVVQVYIHNWKETELVQALAQEVQKNVTRKNYIPLQYKLQIGEKVDVSFSIYGKSLLKSEKKSIVWSGSFMKCNFHYLVPKNIDMDELYCVALLSVNGMPIGEMSFITNIVKSPKVVNPEIISRKFNKVFISYAHQDESKVKFLAEGFKIQNIDYFFDRHYLKPGDWFPQKIQEYIDTADLFVLCWSENASKSEYVEKERLQALKRAFPKIKPIQDAKLSIYPMSIEPHAELPDDMKNNYHFGVY